MLDFHYAKVSLDEGHFNEAAEVLGRFFIAGQDTSAFLEPADESLNDVALPVGLAVE